MFRNVNETLKIKLNGQNIMKIYFKRKKINIVIQINGKKRGLIKTKKDIN